MSYYIVDSNYDGISLAAIIELMGSPYTLGHQLCTVVAVICDLETTPQAYLDSPTVMCFFAK